MSLLDVLAAVQSAGGPQSVAVIGAVARNAWAPPRATTDLDLAVVARTATLASIGASLQTLGYRLVRQQQADPIDQLPDIVVFRSERLEPAQVDLLVAKTSFEEDVLRRAVRVAIGTSSAPVASAEDLIVYKLLADRPRDREDIRAVLRTQERSGHALDWAHIEKWAAFWRIGDRLARIRPKEKD